MIKSILKIITFFAVYLLFTINISAFEFQKSSANPLNIKYINNYANQLQAHIFKEGNLYKGIFVINRPPETYYSLGYFESSDGINWQMIKEILNTGNDLSNPSILKTQTGYLLFISRYDDNKVYRIYSSTCDSNFNCSSNLSQVIMPNINSTSENNGVFAGHPFQQGGRTFLFFGVWGTDGFKIKLAYSDDLINWQRCQYGFLYGGDGPFPYPENNDLYLFSHQSNSSGIKLAKTSLPLSCTSEFVDQGYLLVKDKPYDQRHLIFPSIINDTGILKLYYSGLGSDSRWRLNFSCNGQVCPSALQPIVLIPGFLASWNKDSIIHNISKPQSDWKLNPIVNEYNGIINTLKNLGYEVDKNLFVFAYDWRKPVLDIVEDLKIFISSRTVLTSNFQIVGHSLGGLVGRIYLQKYNNPNISKLITVGSPHHGATVAYKIVESGEIERFNDYLWLAIKMIMALNKNSTETDKQTLNRLIPVMKDIFPIFNFLKKDNIEINISEMKIKNDLLSNYNSNLSNWSNESNLITIIGEKGNTLKGFNVIDQTYVDKILGNYQDGRPQSSFSDIGDYTVLSSSATLGNPTILNLEHGELIYKKEAIKKIIDLLNIQYSDSQIIEGAGTKIDSSLIFLIKSPATMEIIYNGQTYVEQDGIIFIENAQNGDYQLKVIGKENGQYTVVVGQIGREKDLWSEIKGEIIKNPPTSQTDSYTIKFDNNFPKPISDSSSLIDEIIFDLASFNSDDITAVGYMKNDLKLVKKYIQNNDLKRIKSTLILAHSRLMIIRDKLNDESKKNLALAIFEKLENLYIVLIQDYLVDQKIINSLVTQNNGYKKLLNDQSARLLNLQSKGKNISSQLFFINKINTKLSDINNYLNSNKYSSAEILLKTVAYLIKEIKK